LIAEFSGTGPRQTGFTPVLEDCRYHPQIVIGIIQIICLIGFLGGLRGRELGAIHGFLVAAVGAHYSGTSARIKAGDQRPVRHLNSFLTTGFRTDDEFAQRSQCQFLSLCKAYFLNGQMRHLGLFLPLDAKLGPLWKGIQS
jgi:hypothetical protein